MAEKYPLRPVRIVTSSPAGSSGDVMIRLVAQRLSEEYGQQFIVDNRTGGSGVVAAQAVARANSDGHTLLFTGPNLATMPGLFSELPFDPARDFRGVSEVGIVQTALVVNPSIGTRTVKDFIQLAKTKAGRLTFGSAAGGSGGRLSMEMFMRTAGISLMHVPYRGGPQALTGVLTGEIDATFTGVPPVISHVKQGRLAALVVSGDKRSNVLPDVPSLAEVGLGAVDVETWFGLLAPARTDATLVSHLGKSVSAIVQEREVAGRILDQGTLPTGTSANAFEKKYRREIARWPRLVREWGIKPD